MTLLSSEWSDSQACVSSEDENSLVLAATTEFIPRGSQVALAGAPGADQPRRIASSPGVPAEIARRIR